MILAIAGIVLLFVSWGVFQWTLRRGRYRRYPYEQFVLVGASVLLGLASVVEDPSALRVSLLLVEAAALGLLTWYMTAGARFSRGRISLSVGERLPDFTLLDSHGRPFDSSELEGSSALVLFYRGPW